MKDLKAEGFRPGAWRVMDDTSAAMLKQKLIDAPAHAEQQISTAMGTSARGGGRPRTLSGPQP